VNIELTVSSQRPINLLSSQLSKLMDVACVEVQPHAAHQQAAG
ncbi:MAG: acetolactate synthase 2 small subunit, partial [Hafnia sp.]